MGFNTVAINRGRDKEDLARQLGAHSYIDATAQDVVAELQKVGGANVILATNVIPRSELTIAILSTISTLISKLR